MKYRKYTLGQIEAVLNMLGGEEAVDAVLAGKKKVALQDAAQPAEGKAPKIRPKDHGEIDAGADTQVVGTIVVPDLPAVELVALADKRINLTRLNSALAEWDFYRYSVDEGQPPRFLDTRGKRYEVLIWMPGKSVTTEMVRDHFKALGADGNMGAFVAWITETKPEGNYVTIPSDDALLFHHPSGDLHALLFDWVDTRGELFLACGAYGWGVKWQFVAFREIP